jgi:gas vesicle protein
MTKGGFIKGIAVGVVAGAAVGALAAPKSRDARRAVGKFVRAASVIIEDVSALWR